MWFETIEYLFFGVYIKRKCYIVFLLCYAFLCHNIVMLYCIHITHIDYMAMGTLPMGFPCL